jgi:hypothetical protein
MAVIPFIHFLEEKDPQRKEWDETRSSEANIGERGGSCTEASPPNCRTVLDRLPPPSLVLSLLYRLSVPERKTAHSQPTYTECVPQDFLR